MMVNLRKSGQGHRHKVSLLLLLLFLLLLELWLLRRHKKLLFYPRSHRSPGVPCVTGFIYFTVVLRIFRDPILPL